MGELTVLLSAVRAGQRGAVDALVALTHKEIHDLAHERLRRNAAITLLDSTSLVHECYLRLVQPSVRTRTSSFGSRLGEGPPVLAP